MPRTKPLLFLLVVLAGLGFPPRGVASPTLHRAPDPAVLSQECYARIGPMLQNTGGQLTPEVRKAYLDWSEKTVLQQLRQSSQTVPEACLAEVRREGMVRDALFGSVFPPDPSILQNYAQLRTQLGENFLAKYRSLVVAVSIAKRIKGVEKDDLLQKIGRDYQDGFWVDTSLQTPSSPAEKELVRCLAAYMKQSQVSAVDLYETPSWQERCRTFLTLQGVPADQVALVKKWLPFGERLKNALVLLGQRPGARDAKPTTIAWLRHLAAIHAATPISTPTADGKPMPWPLFPVDTAPWPLLMPLAHPVPLREADYIWETFQGAHGPDRYHTYGPYRGDDDVMPDALRPSPWFWDAWPDGIIHGGMCVPLSKYTVDLYSSLGKPAMWAGQPGHANLISFQHIDGGWTAEIEQAFAGGPDVTSAQWYFDEDPGTQLRYRDLYYWPGAEYQLGLALGMNVGLTSYTDTRLAANIFRILPAEQKRGVGVKLLRNALLGNPFNPEVWYRLAEQTSDAIQGLALCEAATRGDISVLSNQPGTASSAMHGRGQASVQYWQTLAQFVTHYSLLSHPAPQNEADLHRVHAFLQTVPSVNGDGLVAYVENSPIDTGAEAVNYDQRLADKGDRYGQLRMGQRYRDGAGVAQDDAKAITYLAHAAGQGDTTAAYVLSNLFPTLPANLIRVTASSQFSPDQAVQHLVDGAGFWGTVHDNDFAARTMWQSSLQVTPRPPVRGLAPSPAWVRFEFAQPTKFDTILIWNHNQAKYTDRGFRKVRLYGSADGTTWQPLTAPRVIQLSRANGTSAALPVAVPNAAAAQPLKAVIIAAEAVEGNYGGDCYGLSAVRFGVHSLPHVLSAKGVTVTTSSVYSPLQVAQHLVDGSGMLGALHDNAEAAQTMWHTPEHPAAQTPAQGLPISPAWARFDFAQPQQIRKFLIWNHNQINYTDRGFRKVRLYGSADGTTWQALTASPTVELPRASGTAMAEPAEIVNNLADHKFKSVLLAAEAVDGNYGGDCYGLSAVRFVVGN